MQGLANAQTNLGLCYQFGVGVAVNHEEAIRWFLKAVQQNQSLAQNNLAAYYIEGIHVKRNHQMAMALLKKSAKQGYYPGAI